MLLGMGAKLLVDLFDQTDLIYDASDYAQVVDVLGFYAWSLPRFIHGSIKYLNSYSYCGMQVVASCSVFLQGV